VDQDALQQPYGGLRRYAGWLDRERASVMVRADVQALGVAIEACTGTSAVFQALDTNIARLPSGDLRKMLRVAAGKVSSALIEPQ
jgi:hypothetical protein